MKDFKNKIVVITGAASGIGKALSLQFAELGAHLALNDHDEAGLALTEKEVAAKGSQVFSLAFDVSKKEAMLDFSEQVIQKYGKVDVMINNAGVALGRTNIIELSYDDFEWVMGINFWGMVYGSKAFLPHLIKQKEASIVNVSSLFGLIGIAHQSAYCTSKFAIRGFTETLRMELLQEQPHVIATCVHPGGIKTNISKKSRIPTGQDDDLHEKDREKFEKVFLKTSAEQAAKVIIKGIRKKKGRVLIGNDAKLPAFISRIFPEKYVNIIGKAMQYQGFS